MQAEKITFKDVAGVDEAKEGFERDYEFLPRRREFRRGWGRAASLEGCGFWSDVPGTGQDFAAGAGRLRARANVRVSFPISRFQTSGNVCRRRRLRVFATCSRQGKKMPACLIFYDGNRRRGTASRGAWSRGGNESRVTDVSETLLVDNGRVRVER